MWRHWTTLFHGCGITQSLEWCDVVGHRQKCKPKCPKETWNRMVNLNHDFTNLVDTVFWSIKEYVYRSLSCQVTKRGLKMQYLVPPFSCQKILISFHLSNENVNSTPHIYRSTKFEEQNLLICEEIWRLHYKMQLHLLTEPQFQY